MYFDNVKGLDINKVIKDNVKILAHIKNDEEESLEEHTNLCKKYFFRIIREKNLENIFLLYENKFLGDSTLEAKELFREMIIDTIIMHDIGKINPKFQSKKMKNKLNISNEELLYSSNHSLISAILYINYYFEKVKALSKEDRKPIIGFIIINSYIISRHHSDLDSLEKFKIKLTKVDEDGYDFIDNGYKVLRDIYYKDSLINSKVIGNLFKYYNNWISELDIEDGINIYIYDKLIFSILLACDFYSTSEFMNNVEIEDLGTINNIDKFISVYNNNFITKLIRKYEGSEYGVNNNFSEIRDINVLRNEMFLDVEKELMNNIDKNIFYIEAPTGSGKSNVALNVSFKLIEDNTDINKIFYVYPFNTLVEQNLANLNSIFKESDVLNEIAVINSVTPIKGKKEEDEFISYEKSLLNRQFMNYPLILTTHVSLFRILFGKAKDDSFSLLQLANSVIVLDEIQSYKNIIWGEIINFLKVYAEVLNIKIIIMSATLPNLDKLLDINKGTVELVKDRRKYFDNPLFKDRVKLNFDLLCKDFNMDELIEHVIDNSLNRKVLIEFIKKDRAYDFYRNLSGIYGDRYNVLLMTGDDNTTERERILGIVKESDDCILVATQVVEAGVDIDMDTGYKDISLFDSEEQFLGRINRSCRKSGSICYFFDCDEANKIYKGDLRNNRSYNLNNDDMKELLAEKNFKDYYNLVLEDLIDVTSNENILNRENFFNNEVKKLYFDNVDKRMKLIDDENLEVSIYLSSTVNLSDGRVIDGKVLWEEYNTLLRDNKMSYSEKIVKLSYIKADMNNFIYRVRFKLDIPYDDKIGEMYFIEDGDKYFENGKLNKEMFISGIGEFI